MKWLILYFSLAVGVSFLCSLLEAVLLTVPRSYIELLVRQKKAYGSVLRRFKNRINRPLSAILTLNTIANTVGAAGVGAQARTLGYNYAVALISALLTLTILIFSEIIPKTIGAVYYRQLAGIATPMISMLTFVLSPFVSLFESLSSWLSPRRTPIRFSRDELIATAEMGKKEGSLLHREAHIIHNLLTLRNIRAKDILTPRNVLLALPAEQTVTETVHRHSAIRFSRIPVFQESLDHVTGYVHRYRILEAAVHGQPDTPLSQLQVSIYAVPETKSIAGILDEFIKRQEHIFLVVDEYGGTAGIVTLEDAVETLLGVEIVDELDSVQDMRSFAKQMWAWKQKMNQE